MDKQNRKRILEDSGPLLVGEVSRDEVTELMGDGITSLKMPADDEATAPADPDVAPLLPPPRGGR